jgi:low temperature requirement protein LtrA
MIQVGRTLFVLTHLGRANVLTPNFRRILGWLCISGALWIAGGVSHGHYRLGLWAAAVACEYVSPMVGFWLPGLGRSRSADWTIDGAHLAERCQLFVMVALGESILTTGASLSHSVEWGAPTLLALFVAFAGSLGMWWLYFDTASKDGTQAIAHSIDPGRVGAYFHYIHVTLIAGIIVWAVGTELIIAEPDGRIDLPAACVLIGGPLIYLAGNAAYKKVVYGRIPPSHFAGAATLVVLFPVAFLTDRLLVGALAAIITVAVALWEGCVRRSVPLRPTIHA